MWQLHWAFPTVWRVMKTEILREYKTRAVLVSENLPPFRKTTADGFSALIPLQHLSWFTSTLFPLAPMLFLTRNISLPYCFLRAGCRLSPARGLESNSFLGTADIRPSSGCSFLSWFNFASFHLNLFPHPTLLQGYSRATPPEAPCLTRIRLDILPFRDDPSNFRPQCGHGQECCERGNVSKWMFSELTSK